MLKNGMNDRIGVDFIFKDISPSFSKHVTSEARMENVGNARLQFNLDLVNLGNQLVDEQSAFHRIVRNNNESILDIIGTPDSLMLSNHTDVSIDNGTSCGGTSCYSDTFENPFNRPQVKVIFIGLYCLVFLLCCIGEYE